MIEGWLVRVTGDGFVAGMVVRGFVDHDGILRGAVGRETAPILKWCRFKSADELRETFARQGWRVTRQKDPVPGL